MKTKIIYFIGIKGVGMAALAVYCKEQGYAVRGSDVFDVFHTDKLLKRFKISVFKGFNKKHIHKDIDLVIYSGAYNINKNVEAREALKKGIKLISQGEALGNFMNGKKGISVAGTHGKTTSAALLSLIFTQANLDPSYIIGCADVSTLPSPGHFGQGDYFIAEADEYQTDVAINKKSRFLWHNPFAVLITNIEYDHPDVFKDINDVCKVFIKLVKKIPPQGFLIYNGDDKNISLVKKYAKCRLVSFGENINNDYYLEKVDYKFGETKIFMVTPSGKKIINLHVPGKHNALNAIGAYALAESLHLPITSILTGIRIFKGAKRRFEKISQKGNVLYYDDYAHHPTEIRSTLASIKNWFPDKRIIVIFQPHTFSRTQSLFSEFTKSFNYADIVIISDIFSSAREVKKNFQLNGKKLAEGIAKTHSQVYFFSSFHQIVEKLSKITIKDDIVITMGAGDIYKLHDLIN